MKIRAFFCITILVSTCLFSTIINVPADQPSIQAAIDAAVDADTVLVHPGTYIENINYIGKNISVASLFLTAQDTTYISQTVIDGNDLDSVVTFENGEDSTAVIMGFTITNGYGTGLPFFDIIQNPGQAVGNIKGGGIHCYYSHPKISNIVITGNTARNVGAGIGIVSSSPIVDKVQIINNTVLDTDAIGGGGIAISSGDPTFNNCEIRNNSVGTNSLSLTLGGGILTLPYVGDASVAILTNSVVSGNYAVIGGGLGFFEGAITLENNLICDNVSTTASAISLGDPSGLLEIPDTLAIILNNCTIANNSGQNGIRGDSECTINLVNSILWGNGTYEIDLVSGTLNVTYSDVLGDWNGTGNINIAPLFENTGDHPFTLQDLSPCINAGIPDTIGLNLPEFDLAGNPRICGGRIDMGAYENQNVAGVNEDFVPLVTNLNQNYPNPFNPTTTISFDITTENPENAEITIYNLKGQKVKTFLINPSAHQPINTLTWNGTDDSNKSVSSGIYFYKLKAGDFEKTRKMILMK